LEQVRYLRGCDRLEQVGTRWDRMEQVLCENQIKCDKLQQLGTGV
jgi:hypothetical protein